MLAENQTPPAPREPLESYPAWLIDLDGTLYRASPVRFSMAAELLLGHWGAIRPLRAFRREQESLRAELLEEVESPYHLQIERSAARLGLEAAELERVVSEWMIRRPGKWLRLFRRRRLLARIARYRAAGGRTALVSDYPASAKLAALGAGDLFEAVVACGEAGGPRRFKPCAEGYLLAARLLEVEPGQCLVVGDRGNVDGLAAARAGMAFHRVR